MIKLQKSIIPACDVPSLEHLRKLVEETHDVKGIGAYKIGFELVLRYGLKEVIRVIREISTHPIIYDHQKAGTDIPDTAEKFIDACKGVNAVIIFPQAGPNTEEAYIKAAKKANMNVIVGGEMTHQGYLAEDNGFINDDMPVRVYEIAANLGIKDFVVPGNKPEKIKEYKELFEAMGVKPIFYSPGLVRQGGSISQGAKAAGDNWHAIIGRGLYEAKDINKAAKEFCKEIV